MKKSSAMAKAERLRKKEAEKLASLAETAPHYAPMHNATGGEFVSRLYCAGRTYLMRVPKAVVEEQKLQPGRLVRLKILQGE